MTTYDARNLSSLSSRVGGLNNKVNQAASNALNRTATKAKDDSINAILDLVTLKPQYVKQRLTVANRASPVNLRVTIQGVTRATLLSRFDHIKVSDGVKVRVNKKGGFQLIKGAFMVSGLKGSLATGIAMNNRSAAAYYAKAAAGSDSQLVKAKAIKLAGLAATKPGGMYVMHSRSITQLFTSIKDDVKPTALLFLERTFLDNINKVR